MVFSRTTASVTITSAGQQVRADFPGEYLRTSVILGAVLAVSEGTQPRPVEGFVLRLTGLQEAADTTDASGRYDFAALRAGQYTVSLVDTEGYVFDATSFTATLSAGQVHRYDFTGSADLFIASDSLGIARASVPFSFQLIARGGATEGLVWSLDEGSRLPDGLTFLSNGTIRGTPLAVGLTEFGVSVIDPQMKRASATLSLRVCEGDIGLAAGEYQLYDRDDLGECGLYIQAPGRGTYYRVTMMETDAESRRVHDVELTVEGGTPAAAPAAVVASTSRQGTAARQTTRIPDGLEELLEEERAYGRAHARLRRSEADLVQRLLAEGPLSVLPDRSHEVAQVARDGARTNAAPEEYEFRIGNPFGTTSGCPVDTTVTATLVGENDYLAVYEYGTSVGAENVQRMLDYYADHGAEVIERYFGGVSDVNGDGLVNVLIRPDIPDEGTRAYVWSADMTFLQSRCSSSNEMELMHVEAAAINDIGSNEYGVLGTVVHEMKHVSSLYKRVQNGRRRGAQSADDIFHPLWIEEGTADIAKEVSSRLAWQRAGGPEAIDRVNGQVLRRAVQPTAATRDEAWGTFFTMARVVWAFSPDSSAVTFEQGQGQESVGDVYGSGWHFHRFLMDELLNDGAPRTAEAELMRELNDSLTIYGPDGIVAVTGRPMEELLIEHAIAMTFSGSEDLLADDVPRFATYDLTTTTEVFNVPDPPGFYPWPVTITGEDTDDAFAPLAVPLGSSGTRTFSGRLAASGVRFHDFRAGRTGDAAAFYFDIPGSARVIVARISDPDP